MADDQKRGIGRRQFLVRTGLVGGGVLAAAGGAALEHLREEGSEDKEHEQGSVAADKTVGFDGEHQPGVVDGAPAELRFLSFTLHSSPSTSAARTALREALGQLTEIARTVMSGRWQGQPGDVAAGLGAATLTVTVGIGASALQAAGLPVPAPLAPLPSLPGDRLDPARSGGDIGVQVCGDDPMAVAAAVRAIVGGLAKHASLRWSQRGFLRGSAAKDASATPRNIMGQVDGTNNPTGSRQTVAVFVAHGVEPAWMVGGTYLVVRRVRMLLDKWEAVTVAEQERVMGRSKATGAPLTGQRERDLPDLTRRDEKGELVIAPDAHIRLAAPADNSGATMQRRGYNYDDGVDVDGAPDAGLFFQAFQTDPHATFVPIQRKLAEKDALSRFIRHESSAVFAVLPGTAPGEQLGAALFR